MKVWMISFACVVLGCVLGASGMFWALTRHYNYFLDSQHAIMAADQINVLNHIRANKTEELTKTMEENMLQWAAGVPDLIHDSQLSTMVLWQVQRYYEEHADNVPETLKPLLDNLPPRPPTSCEIKQNSLFQQ